MGFLDFITRNDAFKPGFTTEHLISGQWLNWTFTTPQHIESHCKMLAKPFTLISSEVYVFYLGWRCWRWTGNIILSWRPNSSHKLPCEHLGTLSRSFWSRSFAAGDLLSECVPLGGARAENSGRVSCDENPLKWTVLEHFPKSSSQQEKKVVQIKKTTTKITFKQPKKNAALNLDDSNF